MEKTIKTIVPLPIGTKVRVSSLREPEPGFAQDADERDIGFEGVIVDIINYPDGDVGYYIRKIDDSTVVKLFYWDEVVRIK